ncbi:MAG TPA: PilN domain-containing protein [Candidatus Eisenbacteria bacterium]|nr:PilN domain-containing protein [Candidatus Eisenbacteria bacterium]
MIRINLLPVKELKAEVARRRELMIGAVSLGAVLVLIASMYAYGWYQASSLERRLQAVRDEIQSLNAKTKEIGELQKRIKEFEGKNNVIEDINRKKAGPVRVMESLSAATPNALWLTEFKEAGGNLTISGVAADNQTIAEFLKSLGTYPYFSNTELVETVHNEQAGMPPRKFLIKSRLSYQPLLVQSAKPASRPAVATPAKGSSG